MSRTFHHGQLQLARKKAGKRDGTHNKRSGMKNPRYSIREDDKTWRDSKDA